MGKSSLTCLVVITFSFSVYESCLACSSGFNDKLEGILGRNINLTCNMRYRCENIKWDKLTPSGVLQLSEESVQVNLSTSYLPISGIRLNDNGTYRCFCYINSVSYDTCQVHLKTICQAMVIINGRMNVYNSSVLNSHSVDVTAGETISIECSKGDILGRRCANNPIPASEKLSTYTFGVLQEHDSCLIKCRLRRGGGDGNSCTVGFTLNVTWLETSTPHLTSSTTVSANGNVLTTTSKSNIPSDPAAVVTAADKSFVNQSTSSIIHNSHYTTMPVVQPTEKDNAVPYKSGSFPVMFFVGISIVVFVGISFIICFFIYFSRSKSTFRPKKTQIQSNESPDTNISTGPTYATVNESTSVCSKDHDDPERGTPCTDHAYAEVNSSMKEESSTQQANAVKAETPITKDYYSVVNTSNTKLEPMDHGNEVDSALYTEVKEV